MEHLDDPNSHRLSGPAAGVRTFVPLTEATVERGYRLCRQQARKRFPALIWAISNLPADDHGAICALLVHLDSGLAMAGQRQTALLNQDAIADLRDNLADALQGSCVSAELAALADTQQRFRLPLQFLFEFIEGVDWLMRFPAPETWEDVEAVAARTGGALVAAAAGIFGGHGEAAIRPAVQLGQALMIAAWLDGLLVDMQAAIQRLATADFRECEIDPAGFTRMPFGKPVTWLARLYGHRLEGLLKGAGPLLQHVNYDGVRVVKALAAMVFRLANNLRVHPERLLTSEGIITPADLRSLQTRHFLGLEMEVPFEENAAHGHH
jgi:phytoene/squalene synthetase